MPLSINVGLSRKSSENYQSTGFSINVTAELDQALLAKPDELQHQIDALYAQAEQAIDRQARGKDNGDPLPRKERHQRRDQGNRNDRRRENNDRANGNGRSNGNGQGMTLSQRQAIEAIAGRLDINPIEEIRHEFGWAFEELSVREASKVIDHLKSLQSAPAAGNDRGGNGR